MEKGIVLTHDEAIDIRFYLTLILDHSEILDVDIDTKDEGKKHYSHITELIEEISKNNI